MSTLSASALVLARQGHPLFNIRLPHQASAPEEFAAEELRRALYAMLGAGPRLRTSAGPNIYINDHEAAQAAGIDVAQLNLGAEMSHLETRNDNVYLLGGGPRGTLYAVYELLDDLGCRWFTPEISRIPRRRSLDLPALRKTLTPAFENRDIYNWECREPLWWARNRLNGMYTPLPEYMGGHVSYCGFVHTFYTLLPPEEFFADHPEYFSLTAGQRQRENAQLCLTNPDVLRLVTQRVLELMRTHPAATIFSVSQNDCAGYCECESCRALAEAEGAQSGPLLHFVNAVAAETSKVYPHKLIDTLAYLYTLDAPRHVTPHPNVRVRLCSIKCCQGHPYGSCDHPNSQRFLHALQAWGRRTSQLYIWHYATDFGHYPLPMPDLDELHGNLTLYRANGVYGVFVQGMGENGGGSELAALRGYVLSKLLWQPQQALWPLVDEFLPAYYGAGAPLVRRYLDIFHHKVRQDTSLHPSLYDLPGSRQYDDDLRRPADEALAEAERLTRGAERQRVRLLRGGLRYARLYRAGGTFRRQGDLYQGEAAPQDLQEFDDLARLWRQAGVQTITESQTFDFSVQRLRSRLLPHRLEWLSDGEQRIAVAPSLGGRVLEWHAHGRQWLDGREPDPSLHPEAGGYVEWMHPNSGGSADVAMLWMYSSRGWGEVYQVERQGEALILTLAIDPGETGQQSLHLKRTIWLSAGKLHLQSELLNAGRAPFNLGWASTLHLARPSAGAVTFKTPAIAAPIPWQPVGAGEGISLLAAQFYTGRGAPAQWQVEMDGFTLHHTHDGSPLERLTLEKLDSRAALSIDLRTAIGPLQPGESLSAHQVLRLAIR